MKMNKWKSSRNLNSFKMRLSMNKSLYNNKNNFVQIILKKLNEIKTKINFKIIFMNKIKVKINF